MSDSRTPSDLVTEAIADLWQAIADLEEDADLARSVVRCSPALSAASAVFLAPMCPATVGFAASGATEWVA